MIADDKPLASEKINGKTVIRERMVLSCLPNYREVRMAMNDGSFHVAPICASCAVDLTLEKVNTAAVKDPKAVGDRRPTLAMDVDFTIKE